MINEGNKQDEYLEKKGESSKTTAMRKASSRRGRFSSGDTHQDSERENITWAKPGTRPHADSLDRQRKSAHRSERGKKKPRAGSSPEDRRWAEFSGDEPEGKYEKLQKAKKKGERTNIEAQKQGLVRKGEKRRQLRTQAVDAIRKAMGGGYVSELKTFEQFMIEAYLIVERPYQIYGPDPHGSSDSEPRPLGKPYKNKKRAKTRADKLDLEIGGYRHFVRKVDDEEKNVNESSGMTPENKSTWKRLVAQHGEQPFTNPRKSKTKSASRREEESTSSPKRKRRKLDFEVREDFVPLTPDKEERVKKRVGELARDIQLQGARMKELKKKPLGRFRPKVKKEKEELVKSARKKAKQVRSASDALIDASTSRSAKIQKRIQDLKGES